MPNGYFGIKNALPVKNAILANEDFVYFDHSYYKRGWNNHHFRAVRNGLHLTKLLDKPDDRMKKFGVVVEPWRKTGTEIVIIPPSGAQIAVYDCDDWVIQVERTLQEVTQRPFTVKTSKAQSMRDYCRDAWAVVTFASVAGVEASLMGIPVFSTDKCPSWPVNAGPLEKIDFPEYVDFREKWAAGLAYASWHSDDIDYVKWDDYNYEYNNEKRAA